MTYAQTGALTIASGAAPILAGTGAFNNSSGAFAAAANSGRWLVCSATSAGDTFAGLKSNNAAVWGQRDAAGFRGWVLQKWP